MNNNIRIIGKKGSNFLATYDDTATLEDIDKKVFMVSLNGVIITNELPVGVFTKQEAWQKIDGKYYEFIINNFNVVKSAVIGAAVGDALGVPYEFLTKKEISELDIGEMIGKDTSPNFVSRWNQIIPSGSWSDDTSMIIATMDSIIKNKGIDYNDIMNNYIKWWNEGSYSSLNFPFGLGSTIYKAFEKYRKGNNPIECGGSEFMDNGNGSLMRILPFSLYCINNNLDEHDTYKIISESSSLTHRNEISIMACYMYTIFLKEAVRTKNKVLAFTKMIYTDYSKYFSKETINKFKRINNPNFNLKPSDINETGYVVDTLEIVMYSLMRSNNYEEVIKSCVKMGYDTDTSACIAGSLAGVIYGYDSIPKKWIDKLRRRDYLESICRNFENSINDIKLMKSK